MRQTAGQNSLRLRRPQSVAPTCLTIEEELVDNNSNTTPAGSTIKYGQFPSSSNLKRDSKFRPRNNEISLGTWIPTAVRLPAGPCPAVQSSASNDHDGHDFSRLGIHADQLQRQRERRPALGSVQQHFHRIRTGPDSPGHTAHR